MHLVGGVPISLGGIVGYCWLPVEGGVRRICPPLAIGPTSEAFAPTTVVRPREQPSATASIKATVMLETIALLL